MYSDWDGVRAQSTKAAGSSEPEHLFFGHHGVPMAVAHVSAGVYQKVVQFGLGSMSVLYQ